MKLEEALRYAMNNPGVWVEVYKGEEVVSRFKWEGLFVNSEGESFAPLEWIELFEGDYEFKNSAVC